MIPEPLLDTDGYPAEISLDVIKDWDVTEKGYAKLWDFISQLWWAEGPRKFTDAEAVYFSCHTWGWSGNEDIISALRANTLCWAVTWEYSLRGGHFLFRIPLTLWGGDK